MTDTSANGALLHPDRLLPTTDPERRIARDIHAEIQDDPILSPHGHCEPDWFLPGFHFDNAWSLLVRPDHYLLRMLASHGLSYESLGLEDNSACPVSPRAAFRMFAEHYHLFRGTPSRLWMDHALHVVLGVPSALTTDTADDVYDHVNARLASPDFAPRALLQRFRIDLLATTDEATSDLRHHIALRDQQDPVPAIIPTFRPDAVTDPQHPKFAPSIRSLGHMTGRDIASWPDYLQALRDRRAAFRDLGATATDHGVPTAATANLPAECCQTLLTKALNNACDPQEAEIFRAQMLFEMARMSAEDGMVMQIHAGAARNYAPAILDRFGLDKGYDLPSREDWAAGLKPLLDVFGFSDQLRIVLYTLDEASYARDLAPLAGAFPVLRLGAPWWFFDSPRGIAKYLDEVRETAGFYNMAGFVDDTRALLSIPARHDMFRRCLASHLARLVASHQMGKAQAIEVARDMTAANVRDAYRLPL